MSSRNHWSIGATRARSARWLSRCAALAFSLGAVGACNSLLDVANPGSVPDASLSDPALAPALAAAALQTLQCGAMQYAAAAGMLSGEYLSANGFVDNHPWEWRGVVELKAAPGSCTYGRGTTAMGFYTPLQQARFQLDDTFSRLEKFTDSQVASRALLMTQMRAYAGYAYLLLGEGMCEMTVDNGPKMTRAEVFAIAEARFTDAIARATAVNDQSLLNMARVGRARARLDLKKLPEAAADAILVPAGFVRNIEFTEGGAATRENRIYNLTIRNDYLSVSAPYRNLTVNGVAGSVPDPRVKVKDAGKKANDGVTPLWQQQKFIAGLGGTPIPLASWNEAQLIYAEAVGGQQGLDAINRVRTANGVPTITDPVPPTGQAFTDLVLEERRRQLFSEGQRYSDMLRYNLPFVKGLTLRGNTYSDLTCVPLPDVETRNNPNFKP
ncbi:MAG: RagB/SusD family nutrient uptake outer membrane protein [Gemmatimonadota bacterium]|nr:RagB/SusD family nutrient uptake outer membrane protein [Gemmatimonadota bacterium]